MQRRNAPLDASCVQHDDHAPGQQWRLPHGGREGYRNMLELSSTIIENWTRIAQINTDFSVRKESESVKSVKSVSPKWTWFESAGNLGAAWCLCAFVVKIERCLCEQRD